MCSKKSTVHTSAIAIYAVNCGTSWLMLLAASNLLQPQVCYVKQLCSYLIAFCFFLAPLQQGISFGSSIFSCQGRQGIFPFFPSNEGEAQFIARTISQTTEIHIAKFKKKNTNYCHSESSAALLSEKRNTQIPVDFKIIFEKFFHQQIFPPHTH